MSSSLSPATKRVTIDSLLLQFLDTHPVNPNAAISYYTSPSNAPNHNVNSNYYASTGTGPVPGALPAARPPLATADANRPVSALLVRVNPPDLAVFASNCEPVDAVMPWWTSCVESHCPFFDPLIVVLRSIPTCTPAA